MYKNLFTIYIVKEINACSLTKLFDYVNSKEVFVQKFLCVEMPYRRREFRSVDSGRLELCDGVRGSGLTVVKGGEGGVRELIN